MAGHLDAGGSGGPSTAGDPAAPSLVLRVDHLVIRTPDPASLFTLLTGPLDLPVAWPLVTYPGFTTGGVGLGNVNLEVLDLGQGGPDSLYGIVLEPGPLDQVLDALRARGMRPAAPGVQTCEIGGRECVLWTQVMLDGLCGPDHLVYLCAYSPFVKPHFPDPGQRRPLGTIGVLATESVVIESRDPAQLQSRWQAGLGLSAPAPDGGLVLGQGPMVRIAPGSAERIRELVLQVASLERAEAALARLGLLGRTADGGLRLGGGLGGVVIRLSPG